MAAHYFGDNRADVDTKTLAVMKSIAPIAFVVLGNVSCLDSVSV